MSSDNSLNKKQIQEIDLYFLWKKLTKTIDSLGYFFVRCLHFLRKNALVLLGVIVIGIIGGYFLDSRKGITYKHEIILVPNFGSSTYLYEKIKTNSFEGGSAIVSIEITPIVDVLNFLSTTSNLKIAEFMSENNVNFSEHKPGNQTEKIYKYHLLTIYTKKEDSDKKIVNDFLAELNKEKHFVGAQKIGQENTSRKIEETLTSIQNINTLFEKLGGSPSTTGQRELNIEMYPEINGLIQSKQGLIDNVNVLKLEQMEQTKIFYDISNMGNIKVKSIPYKIILPFALFFIFIIMMLIKKVYKKYNSNLDLN